MQRCFIEVGCSDFDNLETLLEYGWRGLFVEPVPEYCANLRSKLHGKSQYDVAEMALSNYDGLGIFNKLEPQIDEQWLRGISHLDSPHSSGLAVRNAAANVGKVTQIQVPVVTLDSLLDMYSVKAVELLQLDIEGHELTVLEAYSWRLKPKFIRVEHKFVGAPPLIKLLTGKGYFVWPEQDDLYAILAEPAGGCGGCKGLCHRKTGC